MNTFEATGLDGCYGLLLRCTDATAVWVAVAPKLTDSSP